jgi:coenzyme F420-reducing hydrogenase beta subunit
MRFMIPLVRKARTIHPPETIKCNITYYFAICLSIGINCINSDSYRFDQKAIDKQSGVDMMSAKVICRCSIPCRGA